jgi:hypothetical protein
MFVCCECCALSGRGLCDELITSPEESYRLWCVVVRDLETSRMRKPWPAMGRSATKKKNNNNLQCVHNCEQQECQPNQFTGTNIWEGSRTQRTKPSQCCLA